VVASAEREDSWARIIETEGYGGVVGSWEGGGGRGGIEGS
jgi:hypothetical protein